MPDLNVIIATDCGSTTTKAILIEKKGDVYRQTYRGEAPTTVEAPFEDVTRGVLNAIQEVEELSGRKILDGERIITPANGEAGVDIYISTSSAGGGLQMMVAGVVKAMTGESAQRCALGAGAIVMDVLSTDDGRLPYQKIERIRQLRPDMVLLSGGTDGGTVTHVVEMAEFIAAADPRPRFGMGFRLPVIYAGNRVAREVVEKTLGDRTALTLTENIRPVLERENLGPARHKIHDLFLEHVMAQAPGYRKLISWAGAPIMPTPGAVGLIMQTIARKQGINVIGVDIGGATTDVFSVFGEVFNRTVSANLGMSYSISNVLAEAGLRNILRWAPFAIDEADLRDRIKNKMIRPTTIPQMLEELKIEQAIAREALRLAFIQHRALAVGLKGVQTERTISDAFDQSATGESLIRMMDLHLLVGSGGVLSHAPRRAQSMAMSIDAFQPEGITRIAVDSIFMMPHLGVLSTVNEQAATDVFDRDCMIYLGACVAPAGTGRPGEKCLDYELHLRGGRTERGDLSVGEVRVHPLKEDAEARLMAQPARGFDLGAGRGKPVEATVKGGVVGVVVDARGRPIQIAEKEDERIRQITEWNKAMDLYPK
ncbi:MAG: methylaspartate mutase [Candidatus Handelsmanbacteria bacterium RIFCSPLOWO2_12_FULL_64_10]|uniref:Methylaspartate mutase n=1 Tax=Handelsmanbacteria sp. (strain RIFCSPLOWO2_12_FULL_64_10) TaxID=1817868 RepID=A0A1F6CKV9_HANXR|nr:MAG: methylaspartate mutase [Candidatus Handelsmanbacteria bacterium RIFCSPLOWO2_12_FULL_64_10]